MRKNFKDGQGKWMVTYKGHPPPIRLSADISAEILQARKEWNEILKIQKNKNCQPGILYPAVKIQI